MSNLQRYAYYLYDPMDELMKPDDAGPYVLADEAEAEITHLKAMVDLWKAAHGEAEEKIASLETKLKMAIEGLEGAIETVDRHIDHRYPPVFDHLPKEQIL
jgi:hypothetical protein